MTDYDSVNITLVSIKVVIFIIILTKLVTCVVFGLFIVFKWTQADVFQQDKLTDVSLLTYCRPYLWLFNVSDLIYN